MASSERTPPSKRRRHDADGSNGLNSKRSRRSRWEHDETISPKEASPPSAKGALSDVVKRLSSVIKSAHASPSAATNGSPTDAAAARTRAVAQASLVAMGLPIGQPSSSDLAKRVYVGNLYYDLKEDDVRRFFGPFGTIRSVDLSMEPGTARSKGFCFIEYEDVLAAESAVQVLNGATLSNRTLKVGRPHRGNSSDPTSALNIGKEAIKNVSTKCIYIGGVRNELNSVHLQSIFSPFGEIRACIMTPVSSLETSTHRGFGFIEYVDEIAASNAIQHMNDFELAGQKLKVGKASPSALIIRPDTNNNALTAPVASPSVVKDPGTVEETDARRCVCLLNMVNKGDVDEDLADEVRDECRRFGVVDTVTVHELDDHVRVFVVFATNDGAQQAQRTMHGRFFGGNQVRAMFYPLAHHTQRRYDGPLLL